MRKVYFKLRSLFSLHLLCLAIALVWVPVSSLFCIVQKIDAELNAIELAQLVLVVQADRAQVDPAQTDCSNERSSKTEILFASISQNGTSVSSPSVPINLQVYLSLTMERIPSAQKTAQFASCTEHALLRRCDWSEPFEIRGPPAV